MDKERIASKLTEMGYNATLENGVIMCRLNSQRAVNGLKNALKELSYNGSLGYRIRKDTENEEKTVCTGEDSGEVSDSGNTGGEVALPHGELSKRTSLWEHWDQEESNGNLPDNESEQAREIKQYCRYCSFCSYGDFPYCAYFNKELSDSKISRQNKCKAFDLSSLGDVKSGKHYQPRVHKQKEFDGQISIMDLLG